MAPGAFYFDDRNSTVKTFEHVARFCETVTIVVTACKATRAGHFEATTHRLLPSMLYRTGSPPYVFVAAIWRAWDTRTRPIGD